MKRIKKIIIAILCVGVMLGTTACGMGNGNATDNGNNNNVNDVTDGTRNDGVIEDIGDTTGDVLDDVGDGVRDITDDTIGSDNDYTNTDDHMNR